MQKFTHLVSCLEHLLHCCYVRTKQDSRQLRVLQKWHHNSQPPTQPKATATCTKGSCTIVLCAQHWHANTVQCRTPKALVAWQPQCVFGAASCHDLQQPVLPHLWCCSHLWHMHTVLTVGLLQPCHAGCIILMQRLIPAGVHPCGAVPVLSSRNTVTQRVLLFFTCKCSAALASSCTPTHLLQLCHLLSILPQCLLERSWIFCRAIWCKCKWPIHAAARCFLGEA